MPTTIAALFTDEGYPAGPSDIVARLERFASPDARVIVAEHDGAILGFIAVHALPRFEHDDWIVRDPRARGRRRCPRARRRAGADGRGRADRARARRRVRRGDRRPPSSRGPPPVRVARLRRDRDRLPPQEALTPDRAAPGRSSRASGCATARRALLDLPVGAARSPSGRRTTLDIPRAAGRAVAPPRPLPRRRRHDATPSRRSRSSVADGRVRRPAPARESRACRR